MTCHVAPGRARTGEPHVEPYKCKQLWSPFFASQLLQRINGSDCRLLIHFNTVTGPRVDFRGPSHWPDSSPGQT
ncbi:hypothetical protein RRG08_047691 [Elysia crispata]|uniref:Uncharacterized protein n=1 Tax=Elysia crispata TaxID=231223 RepID=A0AAE1EFQ5_9GAST|nr:hypothetical protein RRG08_047691 [Elysia crispata]